MSSADVGPVRAASSAARCAARSIGPPPSGFAMIVVIPCATAAGPGEARRSGGLPPAWECTSMKPGATMRSRGVDDAGRGRASQRAHRGDAIAGDAEVGAQPGIPCAIHDACVANQDIEPCRLDWLSQWRPTATASNSDGEKSLHDSSLYGRGLGFCSRPSREDLQPNA